MVNDRKTIKEKDNYYQGKLLLATPNMMDFRFEKAVIFICSHSSDGAMGVMINKPAVDLTFNDILKQLNITAQIRKNSAPDIYFGGPVDYGRGFVLHSADESQANLDNNTFPKYKLTATTDILRDIAEGNGPKDSLFALGYAGWGPGQLESEITLDSWLLCDADNELLFSIEANQKWSNALSKIGVIPSQLATFSGSA